MWRSARLGCWPARRAVVRGPSMSPVLRDGDIVLVVRSGRPRPGTVALVRWPSRPGQLSVKRITGRCGTGWWVLGDNPGGSTDSRALGPAEVLGTVRLRLWPLPRLIGRTRRS
jgi:nickel-type superoxide dismutase maturation protease